MARLINDGRQRRAGRRIGTAIILGGLALGVIAAAATAMVTGDSGVEGIGVAPYIVLVVCVVSSLWLGMMIRGERLSWRHGAFIGFIALLTLMTRMLDDSVFTHGGWAIGGLLAIAAVVFSITFERTAARSFLTPEERGEGATSPNSQERP